LKRDLSPSEFFRRARDAQHDSFYVGSDFETTIALAAAAGDEFSESRTGFAEWQALIVEALERRAAPEHKDARRWLDVECVRLLTAYDVLRSSFTTDSRIRIEAERLPPDERQRIRSEFMKKLLRGPTVAR
jgi:hypothetical protein